MSKLFEKYKVEPVGDFILVRRKKEGDKLESGLYVPASSVGLQQMAEVLAVGPGRITNDGTRVAPQVSVGDTVILDVISGMNVEVEGEKFSVVREAEIVAILREA